MPLKIAIIDYDMGNLRSVAKAFEKLGKEAVVTREPKVIRDAGHVVLPGVGAFQDCMQNLHAYGLTEEVLRAIEKGKPFLGICLGLQLLFDESSEFGTHKGLGVIRGKVVRFLSDMKDNGAHLKVPHMGWNEAMVSKPSPLFKGMDEKDYFYFVHSYYAVPDDSSVVLTKTEYGVRFTSAIESNNVFACQFHPEKSQKAGLKILDNFGKIN